VCRRSQVPNPPIAMGFSLGAQSASMQHLPLPHEPLVQQLSSYPAYYPAAPAPVRPNENAYSVRGSRAHFLATRGQTRNRGFIVSWTFWVRAFRVMTPSRTVRASSCADTSHLDLANTGLVR
jgi:hypothetical protein